MACYVYLFMAVRFYQVKLGLKSTFNIVSESRIKTILVKIIVCKSILPLVIRLLSNYSLIFSFTFKIYISQHEKVL